MATSDRFGDALDVVETRWTLDQVADANEVLDAFDDAMAQEK